ncbi:MAG: hypothetical protein ABIH23_18255 [bacterium]
MRTAINIADLDQVNPRTGLNFVALLLRDFVTDHPPQVPYRNSDRWDEAAVILDGPATEDEQRVNALIELLQTVIGPRKMGRRVRCYREGPKGGWSEIRPKKSHRQTMEELDDTRGH